MRKAEGGANPAYTRKDVPDMVYMQYQEDGKKYFAILDKADYEKIKGVKWEGFNQYVVMKNDHTMYLHRILCRNLKTGEVVHHLGDRFDNRSLMLEAVTQKEHDRHRTYCGDAYITIIA